MVSECFGDVCIPLGFRVLHRCFFRATLRAARTAAAVLLRLCLCGPAAHAFGERSTTALDCMKEEEKALLPLILRLTPSPSSSTRRVGVRKEMQTPRCCSCRPYPIRSSWLPGSAGWLPVQPGASLRSGGPRPLVRRAAAAATGRARCGPRPPQAVGPCMLINKVDYRFKASLFRLLKKPKTSRKKQNK